jgi:hypothetical protein
VTSRKDIALLQTRYYLLSRENRALVIAQAGELAARKEPSPDGEREGRETAGSERGRIGKGRPWDGENKSRRALK